MQKQDSGDRCKRWELLPLVGLWVVCRGRIKLICEDRALFVKIIVKYRELEVKLSHVWIERVSCMDTLRFRDITFVAQVFKYERFLGTTDFGLRDFRLFDEKAIIHLSSGMYITRDRSIHSIPAGDNVVCRGTTNRISLAEKQIWVILFPAEIICGELAIQLPHGIRIPKSAHASRHIEIGNVVEFTTNIAASSNLDDEDGMTLWRTQDLEIVSRNVCI